MYKATETAQVNGTAAGNGSVGVEVVALKNLAGVVDGLDDGAFADAVRAEEDGERFDGHAHGFCADAFEVLECDDGEHIAVSFGLRFYFCSCASFSIEFTHFRFEFFDGGQAALQVGGQRFSDLKCRYADGLAVIA